MTMATVTIEGVEYEARGLTPPELTRWNAHVSKAAAAMYWVDLCEAVEPLPIRMQELAFKNPPPKTLNRHEYFRAASRRQSVQILADMVLDDPLDVVITEENAEKILWALLPFVLNKPIVLSGEEGLAKIREAADAGPT